jgi:hypothetical protein
MSRMGIALNQRSTSARLAIREICYSLALLGFYRHHCCAQSRRGRERLDGYMYAG